MVIHETCGTSFVRTMAKFKEYFLNFLPKQSNFKSEIAKAYCYIRINRALEEPLTEALHIILSLFIYLRKQESL